MNKIVDKTLGQRVYKKLQTMLMNVEFLPGEHIRLKDLAEMFGVSILPVREAVWQLVAEDILIVMPNKGIQVNRITAKEFGEIHLMRMALESMVLSHACERRTDRDVANVRQELDTMRKLIKTENPLSYLQQNIKFHHVLYQAADMPTLLSSIQKLRMRVHPYIYQSVTVKRDVSRTLKVHEDMFKGFVNQNTDFAVQALRTDLQKAADFLLSAWEKEKAL